MARVRTEALRSSAQAARLDDQDRLSRETTEMLSIHKHFSLKNVQIWLYRAGKQLEGNSPSDKMFLTIMSSVGQFEREMGGVRTRARITSMREAGEWTGGMLPKGYTRAKIDGKTIFVPSADAPAVREMFTVAAQTHSLGEAGKGVKHLFKIKTSVQYALRNRVYCGDWRTPTGWIKNHHEAIVDQDTFDEAQKITTLKHCMKSREHRRVYTLQGMLRCECCANIMTTYSVKKPNGVRFYYYECARTRKTCEVKRLPAADTEAFIWEQLCEICKDPKKLLQAIEHHEQTEGNIDQVAVAKLAEVQAKLKSAKNRLNTVMAASEVYWNEGKQAPAALMLKIETTDKEVQEFEHALPELKLAAAPKNKVQADLMLRAFREVLADKDSSPERQQAVVRALVQSISVGLEDIKLFLIDASQSGELLGAAVGDGLTSGTERLLDLDSNQEPSH